MAFFAHLKNSLRGVKERWSGRLVGKLGVIGPTRMRYGEITSVIEYLTDNLSDAYRIKGDDDE